MVLMKLCTFSSTENERPDIPMDVYVYRGTRPESESVFTVTGDRDAVRKPSDNYTSLQFQ